MIVWFDVDYEQSLFPLRDSRGKQTSERASEREIACRVELSATLKRDARVEPLLYTRVTFQRSRRFSRSLACSFPSTIPERKEILLVVYILVAWGWPYHRWMAEYFVILNDFTTS